MQARAALYWLVAALLSACVATSAAPEPTATPSATRTPSPTATTQADACPVTEPVWIQPPDDPAVNDPPGYGYYYANDDQSILASAWWTGEGEGTLRASEEGIKTGWFRPEGAELVIEGRRLDGDSPPLQSHFPCCYPTRFQASGLYFPEAGCWEVTAIAADRELTFTLWVAP